MEKLFEVLFEDADLLVVHKPAGLVCHPTKTDEYSSLIGRVRLYLGAPAHPHLLNRLDRETSGVTLVAKTDSAAREIRRLWEDRQVTKTYLALVHGHVGPTTVSSKRHWARRSRAGWRSKIACARTAPRRRPSSGWKPASHIRSTVQA